MKLNYRKYKLENEIFFLILPKYNSTQIQQLQHWYSKCNSKEICPSARNGQVHEGLLLIKTLSVSLFLLQLSLAYNPAFYFNMGQSYDDIYYSPSYVSVVTRNILITIIRFARCHFLLASSSTSWLILCASVQVRSIETWMNTAIILFQLHPWQIGVNCSSFQSLNMLPFTSGKNT